MPPNFMKFGIRGHLTDIIMCVKLLVNRFRGYRVQTPQIALSHWLAASPLQQCTHCRATLWFSVLASICYSFWRVIRITYLCYFGFIIIIIIIIIIISVFQRVSVLAAAIQRRAATW